jgi:hypothetical protein
MLKQIGLAKYVCVLFIAVSAACLGFCMVLGFAGGWVAKFENAIDVVVILSMVGGSGGSICLYFLAKRRPSRSLKV